MREMLAYFLSIIGVIAVFGLTCALLGPPVIRLFLWWAGVWGLSH